MVEKGTTGKQDKACDGMDTYKAFMVVVHKFVQFEQQNLFELEVKFDKSMLSSHSIQLKDLGEYTPAN